MDQRGKRLITIAAIVILLFLGVTMYFIFFSGDKNSTTQSVSVNSSLVPFDEKTLSENNGIITVNNNSPENPTTEFDANPVASTSRERLRKITSFPVSGFTSYVTKKTRIDTVIDELTGKEKKVSKIITTHHIRYNDQRTGHIFDGVVEDGSILNSKIIKTDLPSAEELIFNSTGDIGFLRYEKNNKIETFKLIIPGEKRVIIPQVCTTILTVDLKIKDKNDQVKILQDYLNYKFNQNLVLDGIFGKKTETSVKTIQKMAAIPQTGIVDQLTRDALLKECNEIQESAAITNNNEPKELKGSLIPGYITQLVRNIQTDTIFTLEQSRGKTSGNIQSAVGSQITPVFTSSFNEWLPQYVNKNLITMTTYASGTVGGYMYGLNPTTQTFSKILGPLQGLTTLTSPDGVHAIIATTENNTLVTRVVNLTTGTSETAPFVVLPEKCSWYSNDLFYCGVTQSFPTATYPDDWYKGLVNLSDTLWSYTLSTKESAQIAVPSQVLDIIKMESYPDSEYLFFINKITNELWSYRVGGED
jgi:peptidoglycan hydrolase-like protein with peptidoglycan-binding domain